MENGDGEWDGDGGWGWTLGIKNWEWRSGIEKGIENEGGEWG